MDRASSLSQVSEDDDRQPRGESAPESESDQAKPEARPEAGRTTRAAPSRDHSCSDDDPSTATGENPRGWGESDTTSVRSSTGSRQGLVGRDFLQFLQRANGTDRG